MNSNWHTLILEEAEEDEIEAGQVEGNHQR